MKARFFIILAILAVILISPLILYNRNIPAETFTTPLQVKYLTPFMIDFYLKPEERVILVRRGETVESHVYVISGAGGCKAVLAVAGPGQNPDEILRGLARTKMPEGLSATLGETVVNIKSQNELKIPLVITADLNAKPGIYTIQIILHSDEAHGGHIIPIEIIVE